MDVYDGHVALSGGRVVEFSKKKKKQQQIDMNHTHAWPRGRQLPPQACGVGGGGRKRCKVEERQQSKALGISSTSP
jgi:hypothetical protein